MPDEYNSSYTGAEIDAAIGKARSIEANPTLAGTESSLTGLQIGSTKYKVDGGSGKADKTDLTSIIATGSTNATGATITAGTFFYLNGTLVQAKTDIANGATFTLNTNYEYPSAGALNALKSAIDNCAEVRYQFLHPAGTYSFPVDMENNNYILILHRLNTAGTYGMYVISQSYALPILAVSYAPWSITVASTAISITTTDKYIKANLIKLRLS